MAQRLDGRKIAFQGGQTLSLRGLFASESIATNLAFVNLAKTGNRYTLALANSGLAILGADETIPEIIPKTISETIPETIPETAVLPPRAGPPRARRRWVHPWGRRPRHRRRALRRAATRAPSDARPSASSSPCRAA